MSIFRIACAILVALAAPGGHAGADDDGADQDRVRALVESGRVRPLAEILEILAREVPGEVIEVELERDDGDYIYEIEVLAPNGRVIEVDIDAASGAILEVEED